MCACVRACTQVYHLASVRLRDLCVKLDVPSELRGKIWTCFEHTLVHCTELMRERHLDQLLLCCVYIISKVGGQTLPLHSGRIKEAFLISRWKPGRLDVLPETLRKRLRQRLLLTL